jgi:acetyl esterase/lipase
MKTIGLLLAFALSAPSVALALEVDEDSKDELPDLKADQHKAFKKWRKTSAAKFLGVPVAKIEVGPPSPDKTTILYFHGASVDHANILAWRLARAAAAVGKPILIYSARYKDFDALSAAVQKLDKPIVVMGHSRGTDYAARIAQAAPDKVKHYIALSPVPRAFEKPLAMPATVLHGVDDDVIPISETLTLKRNGAAFTFVKMDEVDHSFRHRPFAAGQKADYNTTAESDEVARTVVSLVHDALEGKPLPKMVPAVGAR